MRFAALGMTVVVAACASTPPPKAPMEPAKVAVAAPRAAPEGPPPPAPLPTESVELTLKDGFASVSLGVVQPKLWTDDELEKRLPPAARAEWKAVEKARKAARDARRKETLAASRFYRCDQCREKVKLEREHAAAERATTNARRTLDKAVEHADKSLAKQLAAPKAGAEIGIALFRVRDRGTTLYPSGTSTGVGYGEEHASSPNLEALERAAELAGPDQEAGQRARQELLNNLWSRSDAERAHRVIAELVASGPSEWRAELEMRSALFAAADGNDAEAAEAFQRALAAHVPGSTVSRKRLATGVLLARYRALDFERTLAAAMQVFEEAARPPPPPPPPPPAPPPKPQKKNVSKAPKRARLAALADAAEFGMLGLLSTASYGDSPESLAIRLAADAVERLDRDPTRLDGPAAARAGILSLLAVRALYRNDRDTARRLAYAARSLGPLAETRRALDVLRELALRDGITPDVTQLEKEKSKLPWAASGALGGEPDERALAESTSATPDARKKTSNEEQEPPVVGNVRSTLRACIEPVRARLPQAEGTGKERLIATLTLGAQVFPDGRVELAIDADRKDGAMASIIDCLQRFGPRAFAHAPSSVAARVALDDSIRRGGDGSLGSLFSDDTVGGLGGLIGADIGEAHGFGGLGLRGSGPGGGGTGEGIGLGSIGTRGRGSGTGVGYGSGRLGGKGSVKNPAPQKKAPASKSQ